MKTKSLQIVPFIVLALLFSATMVRATTYYSKANGAWSTPATWSTIGYGNTTNTGTFPKAGDIANIGSGYTITVSANATCASITIDANGVLNPLTTRTVSATTSITINGTYTNQSTGAITTPSWTCNGTYNHATSSVTIPKGSTASTWAATSNLNITGTYTSATVFANFIGQTFGNVTFNPTSMTNTVCLFGASGSVTVQGNFTITQTGSSTLYMRISGQQFVGVLNINGNFTLSAGIFDMHNGLTTPTTSAINLKGNFTLSGTSKLTQTTIQAGSTVNFNFTGTSVQTVSISPTASITSQATTPTCAIQFTVASGATIDMGTSVLTGTNNTSFTLSAGATIVTANTGGLSSSGATGSVQVNGPRSYNPTANYTYNSAVAGQVTGNGVTAANTLTLNNITTDGVTFSNAIAISGNMSVPASAHVNLGTFTSSAASLTLGGVNQTSGTSYGGINSSAANKPTTYFNAGTTGILNVSLLAPSNLTYNSPFVFPLNVAITPEYPTVTGSVTSYSILPALLPTGLSFNTSTGAITGTPTVNTVSTNYTVTATNSAGNTTCAIVISVGDNRYAVAAGNWNSASTWSLTSGGASGAAVPVSGDLVYIGEGSNSWTVTIPAGYSAVCGNLTMGNYSAATVATLTFATGGTSSLAVGHDLVMNRPNATATSAINLNDGSITIGGMLMLANSDLTPNASASLVNTVNISTGTITTADLYFNGQAAAQSQVVFSGAGKLNISGSLTFGYILGVLTPSTGTVNFNGTSAQTIPVGVSSVTYSNLAINNTSAGGATASAAISATNVTGNLVVGDIASGSKFDNGGFAVVLASGKTLNVANGSTLNLSGTTTMATVSGGGTKTFGATSTVDYAGSAQIVTAETYGHLTLSGSGTKTLPASTLNTAGNFTMSGTASATALAVINTGGNFTLNAGSSFSAATFTHTVGGNWSNNGTFTPGSSTINFNGAGAGNIGASNFNHITFTGAGTKTATGVLTVAGNVGITANFSAGSYAHSVSGNWTNSGTFTPGGSTVTFNGTGAQTINNGASAFNNFTITNTGGTCTSSSNGITVNGTLTTNPGTILDMATFALVVSSASHSGTLLTQNTSSSPLTTGKTWGGLVNYNSVSTAQKAMAGTYNNLSISTTGGATASGDITVNGILNLAAANPSATNGCLEMVTNWNSYPSSGNAVPASITSSTLYMGPSATTTGAGDVSGIVTRNYQTVANTTYSFGNQYTTISFTPGSSPTYPSSVTMVIKIGVAPGGFSGAVKRSFQILPEGGTNCYVIANYHYLDAELNSNTEANLVTWDYDIDGGSSSPDEHGRAAYDFTNNYIGMSNIPINYFQYVSPGHTWRTIFELANHGSTKYLTWTGNYMDTDWTNGANWSPAGNVPDNTCFIIIPDATTTHNLSPVLPTGTTSINTLTIYSGGVLVMGSNTLTIENSLSAGWEDQNTNGNDPGTSTVIFANAGATVSGTGRFYNLTINSGAGLTNASGSTVKIQNTMTKTGTWYCDVSNNTVEYNGAAQTVVLPDGNNEYYNLALSGSGTKTLPATLVISKDFSLAGSAVASGTTLSVGGNFTSSSSGSFSVGTVNLNGTSQQTLGGTATTTFSNLTVDNASGVALGYNETVTGTLNLTSGLITTGSNTLTVGCSGSIANANASKYIDGKLARIYCATGSKDFPTGKGGNYRLLTLNYTALDLTSTVTTEQFESTLPGSLPSNVTEQTGRHWTISQSGATTYAFSLTLDGSPFTPSGTSTAKILTGDGSSNTALAASFSSPSFTATGVSGFGNFAAGSECDPPTIDTQPSAATSCDGTGAPTFTISASGGGLSYQWDESTTGTGGTFTPLTDGGMYSNATSSVLTITNPSYSMNGYAYRVVVSRDCGSSITSDAKTLTVYALPQGTLSGNTICPGGTGQLTWTATAGTGPFEVIYNDGAANRTVSGISSGSAFNVNTNPTVTTSYALVSVTGLYCPRTGGFTEGTGTVAVLTSATWNGSISNNWHTADNWTPAYVPYSCTDVLIPVVTNFPTITSAGTCHNITLESGASLIDNGNLTAGGTATVERFIVNDFKWHFLSSPVAAQAIWPNFAPAPSGDPLTFGVAPWNWDFYYWNPNTNLTDQLYWVNLRQNVAGDYNAREVDASGSVAGFGSATPYFTVGRGYLAAYTGDWNIATGSPETHQYTGALNSTTVTRAVIAGGNAWNLVGNPYPSSLDWQATSGWTRTSLTQNGGTYYDMWILNPANGNYGVINSAPASQGTNSVSKDIAPMQAFFVNAASSGDLTMTSAAQVHSSQSWLKSSTDMENTLRLVLTTSANTYSDEMIVAVNAGFENGGSWKFWSMYTEAPELYSIKNGSDYSIDRIPSVDENSVVPLGIKAGLDATYTLSATGTGNFYIAKSIILEDLKTGATQELKNNPIYSFSAGPGDNAERFHIHFGAPFGINTRDINSNFSIRAFNNAVFVTSISGRTPDGTICIFDVLGRKLVQKKMMDQTTRIDMAVPPGCYIITLFTRDMTYSKKIFIH